MHKKKYPKVFYGAIAVALIIIAFYSSDLKSEPKADVNVNKSQVSSSSSGSQAGTAGTANIIAIKIPKNEVTSKATFYPYVLDGTKMEIIAVKATDGTIRTALNTCQVCYDSGRGYYVQTGDYLICRNCGNRFHIDQIEKIKGGCNPVPIMEDSKQDLGSEIALSKDFIATQKEYFSNWKRS